MQKKGYFNYIISTNNLPENKMLKARYAHKLPVYLFAIITSLAIVLTGCKKEEDVKTETKMQADTTTQQVKQAPAAVDSAAVEKPKVALPDLTGKWTGTFDQHATVLRITSQDSLKFSGSITINYREVINQQVKGSFNPETGTFKMKDQLHSRYQGKYAGSLANNNTKMSGTFTMDLDGKQFPFSLSKK